LEEHAVKSLSAIWPIAALCLLAACAGPQRTMPADTIRSGTAGATAPATLDVTSSDVENGRKAKILYYHLMPLRAQHRGDVDGSDVRKKYPADLVRRKGPVMKTAASYNIYVNCKAGDESCWGDPEGFEKSLTGSSFAGLLTQYTHTAPDGYTFGGAFSLKYKTYTKLLYQNDLLAIVHAALMQNGKKAGYTSMYHVFLPKGTDTCFDRTRSCYSPDHRNTFNFCAYHESVSFKDVHDVVIVSIEPYQKISFCASRASSGAGALTNSTASTLGHEMFESITDPGPAFAWFNFTFFSEVADLCETFQWKIPLNGVTYSIQPMYSNAYHACADGP
jgi:hypothetical protein